MLDDSEPFDDIFDDLEGNRIILKSPKQIQAQINSSAMYYSVAAGVAAAVAAGALYGVASIVTHKSIIGVTIGAAVLILGIVLSRRAIKAAAAAAATETIEAMARETAVADNEGAEANPLWEEFGQTAELATYRFEGEARRNNPSLHSLPLAAGKVAIGIGIAGTASGARGLAMLHVKLMDGTTCLGDEKGTWGAILEADLPRVSQYTLIVEAIRAASIPYTVICQHKAQVPAQ